MNVPPLVARYIGFGRMSDKLEFDGQVVGQAWVPDGEYTVQYLSHCVREFSNWGFKLVVTFEVIGGMFAGTKLQAFYQLHRTRKGLVMMEGSRWTVEMRRLFPQLARQALMPSPEDQVLPPELLRNKAVRALVETAAPNKEFPSSRPYSVVRSLIQLRDPI